jgi:hypothetical protein
MLLSMSGDQAMTNHPYCASRRSFLNQVGGGLVGCALASLVASETRADAPSRVGGLPDVPHFPPKAKRVIYLFQSGGPAQQDLFDYKPLLNKKHGEELPDSVRRGQRLTTMSGNQASLPLAGSVFRFAQHGQSGAWLSELLPNTAKVVDDLCFIKSMYTEAINHDPAITFFQTGSQIAGRPSLGSWVSYGLGTFNQNLPAFVVLVTKNKGDQPLYSRLWGQGFLDSKYQGVKFTGSAEPVFYLENPPGIDAQSRKSSLDAIAQLDRIQQQRERDREIDSRIAQYELAFRMQTSVPEVADVSREPKSILDLYGPDATKPGTFGYNCLLARRLAERGVRFIQLYHQGWDQHGGLPAGIRVQTRETDQPSAALIQDLKSRGMLDDTLVIWGGEFGRTSYSQGKLTKTDYGRDHHPRCFTAWLAGGGIKPGMTFGRTDDYGYNIVNAAGEPIQPDKTKPSADAVHVHDLQATILHLLGINHELLTYKFQGRRYRLTDVHGHVVRQILA